MKLIAQIAAGIIFASLISWGFFQTILYYKAKEIEKELALIANEQRIQAERLKPVVSIEWSENKTINDIRSSEQNNNVILNTLTK